MIDCLIFMYVIDLNMCIFFVLVYNFFMLERIIIFLIVFFLKGKCYVYIYIDVILLF